MNDSDSATNPANRFSNAESSFHGTQNDTNGPVSGETASVSSRSPGDVIEVHGPRGNIIRCTPTQLRERLISGEIKPSSRVRMVTRLGRKSKESETDWQTLDAGFHRRYQEVHELFSPVFAHVFHGGKNGGALLGLFLVFGYLVLSPFNDFVWRAPGFFSGSSNGARENGLLALLGGILLGAGLGGTYGLFRGLSNRSKVPVLPDSE